MADSTVTMRHENGDVRVVPKELEKKYADRGWSKVSASSSKSDSK